MRFGTISGIPAPLRLAATTLLVHNLMTTDYLLWNDFVFRCAEPLSGTIRSALELMGRHIILSGCRDSENESYRRLIAAQRA